MNCELTRCWLDAYLDGELKLTRQLDLEAHLAAGSTCKNAAEEAVNLGSLVRVNMSVYKAPPELKARIQASLQKESRSQLEWFSHFLVLSLFLAWAWIAISHGRDQGLIAEAVSDHSRSLLVNHLLDVTSSDQRVVKPWFTGKLDYSPPVVDLTQAGYKLVGCGKSPD